MTVSVKNSQDKKENAELIQNSSSRQPIFKISSFIVDRWSPRSMTGEELDDDTVMSLFEAARWAPSSYNNQPWRFVYAKRNTQHWSRL